MTHSDTFVSVVIPTYNREDSLRDSVQSVLEQTYGSFEVIIVDDASADDTRGLVESLDSERIRYFEHDENQGAPAARNTGIAQARGEFIAFQDSDDEWSPTKLEKQMRVFRRASDDVGVVYTGALRGEQGEERYLPYSDVGQTDGDISRSLARQNFIPTPVAVVRRACFDEVGDFDRGTWPLSDWELWIRISKRYQFKLVDEALVTGGVGADSISKNRRAKVEARERIVNKHRSFFDATSLARQQFFVGHGYMKLGETRTGRAYLRRAITTKPTLRYVGALCASLLGPGMYDNVYRHYKSTPVKW